MFGDLLRWRPVCLLTLNYSPAMGFETSQGAVAGQQRELSINVWARVTRDSKHANYTHCSQLTPPQPPAPDQAFKPQSGLLSHFQPQGQVRISFMRWHQVEFTFASTSRIPKGSLLKVSVPTCKIFGILLVLICIAIWKHMLGPGTTDLAKITKNVQEPKCGVWDTIWANDKIEYLQ